MKKVLIIGAGPTGLFLAYLLKKRGNTIRLIDKKSGPSTHSKAIAIHSRTLEILYKEGLGEIFQQSGLKIEGIKIEDGKKHAFINFSDVDITYPFALSVPQTETERLLIDACKSVGVEVEWNQEITGFEGNQPILNQEKLKYDWVIGCDGAHSLTRKSHPYTFLGKPLQSQILLADAIVESPYSPHEVHVIFHKKQVSMLMSLDKERCRIMFPHVQDVDWTENELTTVCQERAFDPSFKIKKVLWLNNFKLSERIVNTFRQGNIFILGDAAHIHSPMLAQGMNTCLQDAYNFAWKLDMVIKGNAEDSLLDTFDAERLPVVRRMLRKTSVMTHLVTGEKVPLPFILRIAKTLTQFKGLRKRVVKNILMVTLGYKNSPITWQPSSDKKWKAPALGFRFPNVSIDGNTFLFERLKGHKHVLIHFDPKANYQPNALYDVVYISDPEAQKRVAAKRESIFLIRPDGHIGFRSQDGNLSELTHYLDRLHYSKNREGVVLNV